jgi:hypothetical protein
MPVSIRVCLLGFCLLIAQGAAAQQPSWPDWYAHVLDGSLKIPPSVPKNLLPANGATGQPLLPLLTVDVMAAAFVDVYLSTGSSAYILVMANVPVIGSTVTYQTTVPLLPNTKYYWKFVAKNGRAPNAVRTTVGPIWSFVTVGSATNTAPVVNAGADQTIPLPSAATVQGTASDDGLPAGSVLTTTWSSISGPGPVTFGSVSARQTTVVVTAPGVYVLRFVADDGALSAADDITLTFSPPTAPPTLTLSYVGKTRDAVSPSEDAGVDGQADGEFLLALSASATITKVVMDSHGAQNGTWDTVPANGTWRLGIAATPTGPLLNAADGAVTVTGPAFSAFATDSGYLTAGTTIVATVTLSTGVVLTSSVTVPNPGGVCSAPCVLNPTRVEFDVSPDHAMATGYQLEATGQGGVRISKDLGLPTPDVAGHVSIAVPEFAMATAGVVYTVMITVSNAAGQSVSLPSNTFMRQ